MNLYSVLLNRYALKDLVYSRYMYFLFNRPRISRLMLQPMTNQKPTRGRGDQNQEIFEFKTRGKYVSQKKIVALPSMAFFFKMALLSMELKK